MRISSKSKIAFNILLDIAAHSAHGHAISMSLISKRHGLSHSYLEAIFAILKSAGMIQSHRGPGGGYSLVSKPEYISLKEVVSAIEGEQTPKADSSADLWSNLQVFMQEQMSHITLDKILQGSVIQIEPSTRGFAGIKPQSKSQSNPLPAGKTVKKVLPKKVKLRLGPNSIFSFGKYLQLKKN
jgi:Rrf2 family iron-sulfur cluster assembly transcriptional regulator